MVTKETIVLRESILRAVAYLQRLPRVPATAAMIEDLQDSLTQADAVARRTELSATSYTPVGEMLLKATVRGHELFLTTDLQRGRAAALWQALADDGLHLQLRSEQSTERN